MALVAAIVGVSMLLSWGPLRRMFPSESIAAFVLVACAVLVLFQAGKLD